MDEQKPSSRKVKFAPRAPPPRKKPHSAPPKREEEEDADRASAEAARLLRRFNENLGRQAKKVQKKSLAEVAFDQGSVSSTPLKTYGVPKNEKGGPSDCTQLESSGYGKGLLSLGPLAISEDAVVTRSDSTDGILSKGKEYKEPWDNEHTYYPTSLPLRPPHSGDPEILDEAEFGEAAVDVEYDERSINAAFELGLLEESGKERMLFFQLPPKLPTVKRSASAAEQARSVASSMSIANSSTGDGYFKGLSEGHMGKLLVYKSGKIKLRLGETAYDVSPGSGCVFPQNVAAINALDRSFCVLGDIEQRAVVTPDIDSFLDTDVVTGLR